MDDAQIKKIAIVSMNEMNINKTPNFPIDRMSLGIFCYRFSLGQLLISATAVKRTSVEEFKAVSQES